MDDEFERTWMYLQRVPKKSYEEATKKLNLSPTNVNFNAGTLPKPAFQIEIVKHEAK